MQAAIKTSYRGPRLQPTGSSKDTISKQLSDRLLGVLSVPGLMEGKPALVLNDIIYVR